jgi:class 3 adenylate cyclase
VLRGEVENVTMLFSDIEGSTAMVTRLGDLWIEALDAQRRLCRSAWASWNGTEMGTEGDSFFVVFTDASDAVNAAIQAQESIAAHEWPGGEPVRIRIGIHCGPAVRHEDGFVGLDVHRAARVGGAAHGGQTLLSAAVEARVRGELPERFAIRDLGSHGLKDIAEPERLFQVFTPGLPSIFPPPRGMGTPESGLAGVGDYRFIRALGESTHGNLYLAVPPDRLKAPDELVTVKVTQGADNEASVRRMTRELRAFAGVSSPYLVSLLDAGKQGDAFFYAMEYCELGSLAIPERLLDRTEVARAVAQAARAVHALHQAGLVHRGIKPSNILLKADGARLADFGLVQPLDPTQSTTSLGAISAVDFVEPGLLSGKVATPASDIWSLAATLHWGLTHEGLYGVLPTDDPLFCVRRVLTSPPELSAKLRPAEAELVARCITGPADQRPSTALALAEAIEGLP